MRTSPASTGSRCCRCVLSCPVGSSARLLLGVAGMDSPPFPSPPSAPHRSPLTPQRRHTHQQAVDTIHRERIVHSDLKPANFLVVEGQLKLIDFGIAKAIQSGGCGR